MTNSYKTGMIRATELTQAGKLKEATALIQSFLVRQSKGPAAVVPDSDAIEGTFTRLDAAAPVHTPKAKACKPASATRCGLAETLRTIAAGGMRKSAPHARKPMQALPGAQFLALTYASAQGNRDYRLYIPANQPGTPMPLIVMLHGCTQSPEDFAAGTGMNALAEEFGCLVAYPAQPSGANAQKCWNWFRAEDQGRDCGEPALIAGITKDILRSQNADPTRVYIAGLSAGGAAAAIMAAAYPDLFAAVGVHSGLAMGAAQDIPSAFSAMRSGASGKPQTSTVPTIVFHGLADTTVHPSNGAAVIAQATRPQPGKSLAKDGGTSAGGRRFHRTRHTTADGRLMAEHWEIEGAGHAWAGGSTEGSYTDPAGPDASREMLRFFRLHAQD